MSLEDLKGYFTFTPDLEVHLQDADTIAEVMQLVQQISSYTNCVYLEEMVDHVNIPEAKKEIDAYMVFMEEYCQKN